MARQNTINPSGKIETDSDRIYVRVDGEFDVAESIAEVPIQSGGRILKLGDIADIKRGYRDPAEYTVRYNGLPAIGVGVVMRKGGNVLAMGRALNAEMARAQDEIPHGYERGNDFVSARGRRRISR